MLSQISSGEVRQRRTKIFLGELYDFPHGIMPVGRLDEKSEGLLLMTTDGKLTDYINNQGVEKEYWAQVDGLIDNNAIENLKKGVSIGNFGKVFHTRPCQVNLLQECTELPPAHPQLRIGVHRPTSWIRLILTEGKFRQIRKMTAAVGFPTLRLVRIRIGPISLDKMEPGEVVSVPDLRAQFLGGKAGE